MVLILRHTDRETAYVAQTAGVSPVIAEAARDLEIPVQDDGGITADLMIHSRPLLIHDIETVTERLYPPVLEILRRSRFTIRPSGTWSAIGMHNLVRTRIFISC